VLPNDAAETIALWILFSYCIDALEIAPRLILSVVLRSGKTTLLRILARRTVVDWPPDWLKNGLNGYLATAVFSVLVGVFAATRLPEFRNTKPARKEEAP
jgi:hypothetical protein